MDITIAADIAKRFMETPVILASLIYIHFWGWGTSSMAHVCVSGRNHCRVCENGLSCWRGYDQNPVPSLALVDPPSLECTSQSPEDDYWP